MNKGNQSSSDKLVTLLIVVAVIIVLGLAVMATYGKVTENITKNKIESGEIAEPVWHAAEAAGVSIEEYLAEYNLTVSDEVNGDTPVADLYGYMTLENYLGMANEGNEDPVDLDQIIEEWGLTGKVTKDTMWKDVELLMPLKSRFSDEDLEQYKQTYNLGDEVTGETSYGDFIKIMEDKSAEQSDTESDTETQNEEEVPAEAGEAAAE